MGWWSDDKKIHPMVDYEGLDDLQAAHAKGKGVILVGALFPVSISRQAL